MRYLKKFNETLTSNVDELREYSESYLAYLLDDGFELNFSTAGDYSNTTIQFTKTSSFVGKFNWNDIKDIFIPYMTILNDNYDIRENLEFDLYGENSFNIFFINKNDILNDNIENVTEDILGEIINDFIPDKTNLSECDILSIEFTINNQKVNENIFINKDNTKELREFSDQYLAYLYDDGFHVYVDTSRPYSKTTIKFVKNDEDDFSDCETTFTWDEIKDTFISYISVLNENYELQSVLKFDLDFDVRYLEFFVSVDDILNDNIENITSFLISSSSNNSNVSKLSECDILSIEITIIN